MIEINITLLFQLVNFIIGLLIINHFIIKPLREVMAKRRAIINGLDDDVNGLSSTAKSKIVEYEARLQKTKAEIARNRDDLKGVAFSKAQTLQNDASEKARELRQSAQDVRLQESDAAYQELKSQSANFAKLVTSRLLS